MLDHHWFPKNQSQQHGPEAGTRQVEDVGCAQFTPELSCTWSPHNAEWKPGVIHATGSGRRNQRHVDVAFAESLR
jgi:hypothetical protein